jgi:type II secretory pathway component HofQ
VGLLSLFCLPGGVFAQPLAPVPVTRLEERPSNAGLDAPHAVSLSVADPIPLKDALLLLVRGTPFSLVFGEHVDGVFAGELKRLTLHQAMESILHPHSLDYTVDGPVITVHRRKTTMRLFDVSYLNVRRDWKRTVGAAGEGLASHAGGTFYDEIERGIAALVSPDGRAHVDRHSGVVQVTDYRERLDRIATYLETVHTRALRQVRVSVRVVEVALADPSAQAIDWAAVARRSGEPWGAWHGTAGVRVHDFAAVLDALRAQGSVRTLATPQLVTLNSEPATMTLSAGVSVTVTPFVDAGGMVQLSVAPAYVGERVAAADTVVRIGDGESILLAGFLQRKDAVSTELVILLNATVVTAARAGQAGTR